MHISNLINTCNCISKFQFKKRNKNKDIVSFLNKINKHKITNKTYHTINKKHS